MTTDERLENLVVTVETIAGIVKDLAETQTLHKEQLALLTNDVQQLAGIVFKSEDRMDRFEKQAEADRHEMREGINAMLTIAEEMKQLAIGLTLAQQGTSQRVTHLERRVDVLENPTKIDS